MSFITEREDEEVEAFLRVNMRTLSHLLIFVYAGETNVIFQHNSISALSVIKNGSFNEPEPVVSESQVSQPDLCLYLKRNKQTDK